NGNGIRDNVEGDQFYDYGFDQWAQYHKRYTNSLTFKGDITSQITKVHYVKTGFEFKRFRMKHEEIQYPWYMDESRDPLPPGDWPLRGIFRDYFTRHPASGAYYIQDKIETKGMIINLGLRLDFTYAGPEVEEVRKEEFSLFGTEIRLSPRFGISFPISEFDKMYFSYGHFSQVPEFQYFYQDTTQFSSAIRLYGNPNLHSEETIAYQIGVVHAFGNRAKMEVRGFYKDIRKLIDTESRGYAPFTYQIRVNKDYGSVRGVELHFDGSPQRFVSLSFDYSLMWAMGKSSSDRQGYDYDYQGIPLPLREYPLDWDQRHSISTVVDLRSASGEFPVLLGLSFPDKWGINILTQFATGFPYTPAEAEEGGRVIPNSARKPNTTSTNIKATKWFFLGPLRYEFLVEIRNVFDRTNILRVYSETGRPDVSDKANIEYEPDGVTIKAIHPTEYDLNPLNWQPRRNMFIGFSLGYSF
ncbi:MAG: TonB-dependent receptor, partial [Candidatus Cloacimonadota bacterium]